MMGFAKSEPKFLKVIIDEAVSLTVQSPETPERGWLSAPYAVVRVAV